MIFYKSQIIDEYKISYIFDLMVIYTMFVIGTVTTIVATTKGINSESGTKTQE